MKPSSAHNPMAKGVQIRQGAKAFTSKTTVSGPMIFITLFLRYAVQPPSVSATQSAMLPLALAELSKLECWTLPVCSSSILS